MKQSSKTTGLRYWMLRVLEECDNVAADFSSEPVHDLRVALRRCRSMADGLMAMDPNPEWKAMKKAGKALFQRLGDLRDVQIMMEWVEKLYPKKEGQAGSDAAEEEKKKELSGAEIPASGTGGQRGGTRQEEDGEGQDGESKPADERDEDREATAHVLLKILGEREARHKHEARAALGEFDQKQWRQWSKNLPQSAGRIRPGSAVYKHLALERWTAARELHTRALRNRSQVALHTLRIGIKRFRYIVENFLPAEHTAWSDDLKHMQDLLGEVHDLDVLWATALGCRVFTGDGTRKAWHGRIVEERTKRIDEYRQKMVGPDALWHQWRAGLPQGRQIAEIATQRMKLWARALDPDFAHSERVARLSLELYDGLTTARLLGLGEMKNGTDGGPRAALFAAALLHDVGKSKGDKGHHKESLELIKKHGTPLGWNEKDMQRAAVVARFHCGALPTRGHRHLRDLLPDEQRVIVRLSAILRLANALDAEHTGAIRRVRIENKVLEKQKGKRSNGFVRKAAAAMGKDEALVVGAEGYVEGNATAQRIAAERYLLETVVRRPVIVRCMKSAGAV